MIALKDFSIVYFPNGVFRAFCYVGADGYCEGYGKTIIEALDDLSASVKSTVAELAHHRYKP